MKEGDVIGWHHRLNGHEFEQTSGDSKEWESMARCSPWGSRGQTRFSDWRTRSLFGQQLSVRGFKVVKMQIWSLRMAIGVRLFFT